MHTLFSSKSLKVSSGLPSEYLSFFVSFVGFTACTPLWPGLQFHNQDGSGSYSYGYQGPHHAKMESRSNGITQGGYSYVDANGILQNVAYTADPVNGFRVRASNLPQQPDNSLVALNETPEVAEARRNHLAEYTRIANSLGISQTSNAIDQFEQSSSKNPFVLSKDEASRIEIPKPAFDQFYLNKRPSSSPLFPPYYNRFPVDVSVGSYPVPIPPEAIRSSSAIPSPNSVVISKRPVHSSLRHTQDSLGQYDYSYTGDTSAKSESRSLDGTTRGAYSYIDANGLLQQVHYIADHNGFRVLATNLPEA
ncbi:Similar to Cuticle protein 6 (Blaberus craniifer) [Cotesia congregata]|uniref:Similar to Cuticle protein 6 (Blaberus craniifer) n=1 Tax=Cotesia congregata TaxID=51543 RepID=A0A8J2HSR3_COTCN|nr:Similar to Cuticle protein 6 (Blaberus craniifer) [Cotesia congregata]